MQILLEKTKIGPNINLMNYQNRHQRYPASMIDPLLDPLDLIVPIRSPMVGSFKNYILHVLSCLNFTQLHYKTTLQVFQGSREEARQA